ncbi:MAG: hypothetical protein JSU73_06310 [candidate division WOR-3 bacterium]|nr:MAG: hypothetical protein JSU73_06310 [candidate division WOR-3 bacterium]
MTRLLTLVILAACSCPAPDKPERNSELETVESRLQFEYPCYVRPSLYHPDLPILRSGFAAAAYPEVMYGDLTVVRLMAVYQRGNEGDSLKMTKVTIRSRDDTLVFDHRRWRQERQLRTTPDGRTIEVFDFPSHGPELEAILVPPPTTVILSGAGGTREYEMTREERQAWRDILYYRANRGWETRRLP